MDISAFVGSAAAPTAAASTTEIWTASLDVTTYVVYAVALLLLASVIVFIKVVFFNKRPQKMALVFMLLAIPLYLVYYDDRFRAVFGADFRARSWVGPLVERYRQTANFDPDFHSDISPAIMVGIIMLFHLIVLQRLASREHLQRIANLTSTFFAGSAAATMLGGTVVSTFHLGWIGSLGIGFGFALVYLGALALLAAIIEITVELSRLAAAWIKRRVFALATRITRAANWIAALGGRLVSRALIEQIRAATAAQEGTFLREQDEQDRLLLEAYIHDLDRKRQARLKALRAKYGDDDSIADLRAYVDSPSAGAAPAAPSAAAASEYTPPPARDPFDTASFETTSPVSTLADSEPSTRDQ
jgi:hypothetical protein